MKDALACMLLLECIVIIPVIGIIAIRTWIDENT